MIGQADAATTIQIAGSGMDLFFWLLLIGGVGCITAICLFTHYVHKNK